MSRSREDQQSRIPTPSKHRSQRITDLAYRLLERPMRVFSLRTLVAIAALGVMVLVVTLGTWVWLGVEDDQNSQLDRRLDSVSSLGAVSSLLNSVISSEAKIDTPDGLVLTARVAGLTKSIPSEVELPLLDPGYANTTINGVEYRVRSFIAPGNIPVAVGAPIAETQRQIDRYHIRILAICGGVLIGTVIVGWVISLIVVSPFRLLAQQARLINAQSNPDDVNVRGVREAVEISEAVEGMLERINTEQEKTKAALETARDFSAVASHELRTPLTAMRTNLEVLTTLNLSEDQRAEILEETVRTQTRIEATLSALERLAQGDLTTEDDHVPVDITELLDRAAHDADRSYPNVEVSLVPSSTILMLGLPAGLRLVIDNAIKNAVRHGGASEVRLSAISTVHGVEIAIDDNGTGIPEAEREIVFERFSRGSTASHTGSGLGLALVAQQAELHGGTAALECSPLGGARLVLRLPGH
ncbi:Sensor-type histidine kinase PrrB [Mycobacteroides salmoniphilum]|uniref:histidine kinase n=2 Tax=Mycobacteroides salmoniphilum TaxID=404941 RepID=A0A4R8RXG2_9MYCO|nr:Sensor-type histidine kinase PrrB [Mycobacteroides salmoniphilum]